MASQFGSEIVLSIGDGQPSEAFSVVAGLTTKTLSFNGGEGVDVSDSDSSNKWRELMAGATLKSFSITGEGVFKDTSSENMLREKIFPVQVVFNARLVLPSYGTLSCPVLLSTLDYTGEHQGSVTFSLDLQSAGEPTWTPI